MTTGIFQKPCPACAVLLPREATACDCGYMFDADEDGGDEPQQLLQEELFETYLTARVQQALADLEAARATLATTPTNTKNAYALLARVQTLQQHRLELRLQQEKIAALRARVAPSTAVPSENFRAVQAARAAQIVGRHAALVDCPHCGAAIPADIGRCTCPTAVSVFVDSIALQATIKPSE